jgi:phage tail-like protein
MAAPQLQSARACARRKIELTFDSNIQLRGITQLPVQITDRYTPVDWVGAGGNASDAFNPANYVITRPSGGDLDGPAEAVDLTVIAVEEPETGVSTLGPFYIASQVILIVDFDQTARSDYRVEVSNVVGGGFVIDPAHDTADFEGYVVSQVIRNSLHLFDKIPAFIQRMDQEGTGELELFCTAFQEVFDRVTEDIDAYFNELSTIEYMRSEWLDGLLYDLGDQFSEIFNLTSSEKRKLARSLVEMYKLKGTCVGIVNVIDYFLGITILGCRGGWDDCWELADGAYPAPVGGNFLSEGIYPAQSGGDVYLGPVGSEIWSFWLLHAAPGALTADELAKIAAIVDLWKPAYSHYMGVTTP